MKKILIVDDNGPVVSALSMLLVSEGYDILSAMDAMQAMNMITTHKPDLILLDLKIPAGGGMAVYDRVKQSNASRNTPIIFLTAAPIEQLAGKIAALDRKLFINKPWNNDELLAAIQEQLTPPTK